MNLKTVIETHPALSPLDKLRLKEKSGMKTENDIQDSYYRLANPENCNSREWIIGRMVAIISIVAEKKSLLRQLGWFHEAKKDLRAFIWQLETEFKMLADLLESIK
jgi:hypothetical protein